MTPLHLSLLGQAIAGLPVPHEEVRGSGRAAGAQPQGRLPLPDAEGPHGQHGQAGRVPFQDEEDALRGGRKEAGQLPLQDQGSQKSNGFLLFRCVTLYNILFQEELPHGLRLLFLRERAEVPEGSVVPISASTSTCTLFAC